MTRPALMIQNLAQTTLHLVLTIPRRAPTILCLARTTPHPALMIQNLAQTTLHLVLMTLNLAQTTLHLVLTTPHPALMTLCRVWNIVYTRS